MKNIKQKLIAIVLAALMLIPMLAAPTSASSKAIDVFEDLKMDTWYYDSVEAAYEMDLMEGIISINGCIANYVFLPEGQLTREEFVQILMRSVSHMPSQGVKSNRDPFKFPSGLSKFADVDESKWYSKAVMWAEDYQVTNGVTESLFGIGQSITREEMATLIYRYMSRLELVCLTEAENTPDSFADEEKISDWAVDAVDYMRRTGIIMGDESGNFRPGDTATRAEAAAIFVRLFNSAELDFDKIFDENNVGMITLESYMIYGGEGTYLTLEGEEAKEVARYLTEAAPTSQYCPGGIDMSEEEIDISEEVLTVYDINGKCVCGFNFTESSIFINGFKSYNYKENYLKAYYDRLYES